jgi:hypothetical protein
MFAGFWYPIFISCSGLILGGKSQLSTEEALEVSLIVLLFDITLRFLEALYISAVRGGESWLTMIA